MGTETIGEWVWQDGWGFAVWRGPDGREVGLDLSFSVRRWCVWAPKPPAMRAYDYRPVVTLHDGPHTPPQADWHRREIGRAADAALAAAGWAYVRPGDAGDGLLRG